jgi:Na+:H+ antiporter, NhaA family
MESKNNFFETFISKELLSSLILVICIITAIVFANSAYADQFANFWHLDLGIAIGNDTITMDLKHWIDDGLMAIFFLMVGLEMKRELMLGELNTFKSAMFPIIAAIGGMIVPACVYLLFNYDSPNYVGFGIPMATDIAFALAVIMLFGKRIPLPLKIFLLSLAIVDDMGAVILIAIAYSKGVSATYLLYAFIACALMFVLNLLKQKQLTPYILLSVLLWFFMYKSGVHATIAGVLTAFFIPIYPKANNYEFLDSTRTELKTFEANKDDHRCLRSLS